MTRAYMSELRWFDDPTIKANKDATIKANKDATIKANKDATSIHSGLSNANHHRKRKGSCFNERISVTANAFVFLVSKMMLEYHLFLEW